ncbi:hypothetical protein EB796_012552 [Bugula neritina]|uniref:ABCG2 n=1 Tax=Bugula neritina TaxID=10212 RepID=A0A7J7JTE1_BUGNE|nr:hypothetical protein EB796_012552 [Bugula neritina]
MPTGEKKERVMELVDALDMNKFLHTRIGDASVRGLSGGEKKKTTIACELLTNPALMLLDEPTSGLDSSNAFSLCNTLKKFAKDSGKILIASIHQPSSQIFNMFDKLLLLCDGKMAYFGEVKNCAQHFASLELPCPANYNLADHILDQVKGAQHVKEIIYAGAVEERKDYWLIIKSKIFLNSKGLKGKGAQKTETEQKKVISKLSSPVTVPDEQEADDDYAKYREEYEAQWPTGFLHQFSVLFHRQGVGGLAYTAFIDLSPSLASSSTVILVFTAAGSFYTTHLPFWMEWIKYVSFMSHAFYSVLIVQYSGTRLRCSSERSAYSSCQGSSSALYSNNQSAFSPTNQSEVIKYISTEELLLSHTLVAEGWTIYYHVIVLITSAVILKAITYLLLRFARSPRVS